MNARHRRIHNFHKQKYNQCHNQEIDHGGDKFPVIECDIARDIPRELVKVHAAEQTKDWVDNVIDKRGNDACECAADDDTDSHVHHISFADKLLKFFEKFLYHMNAPFHDMYCARAAKLIAMSLPRRDRSIITYMC